MSEHDDDLAAAAEQFAGEPGKAQIAVQALSERANDVAYGSDTSGPDKILKGLGFAGAAQRRKAAAKAEGEKTARAKPPAGRRAPAKTTTA